MIQTSDWRVEPSTQLTLTLRAETLIPRLSELPGFGGYFLFRPANGVLTSISLFETSTQVDEPNRVAAEVVRDVSG